MEINTGVLDRWMENHRKLGGHVFLVHDTYALVGSPEQYVTNLYDSFRQLSFETVNEFVAAGVTDNTMQHRDILEDASKIHYLRQQIRAGKLAFRPQLLHEPWRNRWRVHPGSGRYAAMWMENPTDWLRSIYIYFNEPGFEMPTGATAIDLRNPAAFINAITLTASDIDFTTHTAFERSDRDTEWHPNITTDKDWQFLRYSEGEHFLNYKQAWRDTAVDLWLSLNR
jgi:hypothetical protein